MPAPIPQKFHNIPRPISAAFSVFTRCYCKLSGNSLHLERGYMQSPTATLSFGALLKQLRKQAGMTQRDLAAALNYSDSLISSLEKEQRKPDLTFVIEQLIPALGLQA